jgi:diaminopimelate epimerase
MNLSFVKYQGTGNDFVVIDDRKEFFDLKNNVLVKKLCDRKFGIGADGLILLRNHPDYDFEMIYFNSDGFLGSMCGNGGRCIVDFAKSLNIFDKSCDFLASDGPHFAKWQNSIVSLKMNDVNEIEYNDNYSFLNTGSPHYVELVENLKDFNVFEKGKEIRYNNKFRAKGTNVNFVEMVDDVVHIRTYERGVENETLACGTGAVASVLSLHNRSVISHNLVNLKTLGGDLQVSFQFENNIYKRVYLKGPAKSIFKGEISC